MGVALPPSVPYANNTIERRRRRNLCVGCGREPPAPGLLHGEACRAKMRAKYHETKPADAPGRGRCYVNEGPLVRCAKGCGALLWVHGWHKGDTVHKHKCPPKPDPEGRREDSMERGSE